MIFLFKIKFTTSSTQQDTIFTAFKTYRAMASGTGLRISHAQFMAALPNLAMYEDFIRDETAQRLWELFDPNLEGYFSFQMFSRVVFGAAPNGSVGAPFAPVLPFAAVKTSSSPAHLALGRRTNRSGMFEGRDEMAGESLF